MAHWCKVTLPLAVVESCSGRTFVSSNNLNRKSNGRLLRLKKTFYLLGKTLVADDSISLKLRPQRWLKTRHSQWWIRAQYTSSRCPLIDMLGSKLLRDGALKFCAVCQRGCCRASAWQNGHILAAPQQNRLAGFPYMKVRFSLFVQLVHQMYEVTVQLAGNLLEISHISLWILQQARNSSILWTHGYSNR